MYHLVTVVNLPEDKEQSYGSPAANVQAANQKLRELSMYPLSMNDSLVVHSLQAKEFAQNP